MTKENIAHEKSVLKAKVKKNFEKWISKDLIDWSPGLGIMCMMYLVHNPYFFKILCSATMWKLSISRLIYNIL